MCENCPRISLRAARVNAGLTQRTAADRLKLNVRTLQKYEAGAVVPGWDTVLDMAGLYGIGADYFLFTKKTAKSG